MGNISDKDFYALESQLLKTAKGKSFLERLKQENKVVSEHLVKRMFGQLETNISQTIEKNSNIKSILTQELKDMAASISKTQDELKNLKSDDQEGGKKLDEATNELDEIVKATANATDTILDCSERIQNAVSNIETNDENKVYINNINNEVTKIFESCSFQDITGQRITKVVNALRYIENRVNEMLRIWDNDAVAPKSQSLDDIREDAHLLNGPQSEGQGVKQEDIDKLFSSNTELPSKNTDSIESIEEEIKDEDLDENSDVPVMSQEDIDKLLNE